MKTIPLFKVYMSPQAKINVGEVLDSGFIGEGPKVKELEHSLHKYFTTSSDAVDIITVNSATSAEHLIYAYFKKDREIINHEIPGVAYSTMKWEGLRADDEVLSTPLTCTATNWPIITEGLNLRWVDVDPLTCNMSLDALEKAINEKTRIVTIVHWGGNPIDLDRLTQIVSDAKKKYGREILIVEDCAHALGSMYKGVSVGFTGNYSTFSLQAIKHITTGDGGFVVCPSASVSKDFRLLRWYGIDRDSPRTDFRCETDVAEAGYKYHMNDISAAIGLANLQDANKVIGTNKSNGEFYNRELVNIPGITIIPQVEGADSAYWLYTFHTTRRDELMNYLDQHGIKSSRVHERNDKHTCTLPYRTELPGVDQAVKTMLSIPVGYWVTEEDREYIVNCIKNFHK